MTVLGRRLRMIAVLAVFGLLLAGTMWGEDDHFPFGPFRMYASTEPLDGVTAWYWLQGVDGSGASVEVPFEAVGVRRAELEGRLGQLAEDPSSLAGLAERFEQAKGVAVTELRVVRRSQTMEGGQPDGPPVDEVVVVWRR